MNLRDPDLTMERVAREHGISQRYAYLILARLGISPGDWVRTERLAGAARDLLRPVVKPPSIAEIASSWGFSDQANFTRAFRRQYGMSPREYRRAHRADPLGD